MKKRLILNLGIVVCVLFVCCVMQFKFKNNKPFSLDANASLLPGYDYGIDATIENSDFVGMITVKDTDYAVGEHKMILASVKESYMGSTVENEIIIPNAARDELVDGKDYLVFLYQLNHYAFPDNTYKTSYSDAFFEVSFAGKISSLSQISEETIEDINTIAKLTSYLDKYPKSMSVRMENVPDSFDKLEDIISYSDRIAKIKIKSVDDSISATFIAEYDIVEVYKGESWSAGEGNFLPRVFETLNIDEEYIVFFAESEDGTLMPAAREDSLIASSDVRFVETEEYYKKDKIKNPIRNGWDFLHKNNAAAVEKGGG